MRSDSRRRLPSRLSIVVATVTAVATGSCGGAPAQRTDSTGTTGTTAAVPVITPSGAGALRVGMTLAEARSVTTIPISDASPARTCGYLESKDSSLHVRAMTENGRIIRVEAKDSTIAAAGGGRIGDPEARVLELYGDRVKIEPHKYVVGGHYLVLAEPGDTAAQTIFETDGQRVVAVRAGRLPGVAYVEGCG